MRPGNVKKVSGKTVGSMLAGVAALCLLVMPQTGAADYIGGGQSAEVNAFLNPEAIEVLNVFGQTLMRVPITQSVTLVPEGSVIAEMDFLFGPTTDAGTFSAALSRVQMDTFNLSPQGVTVVGIPVGSGRTTVVAQIRGAKRQGTGRDSDRITLNCCVGAGEGPPVADAGGNQDTVPGTLVTLDGTGSSDPNFDSLTFSWEQVFGPPVALSDPGSPSPTFTAPSDPDMETRTFEFDLTVSDGIWSSFPDRATILVVGGPEIPTCDAGPDQMVIIGDTVTLAGTVNDPQGLDVTCTWSQTSGPDVILELQADPCLADFVVPPIAHNYGFELSGTNTLGLNCVPDALTVVAEDPNLGPVARAGGDQMVFGGQIVTLDCSASDDPDNKPDPLSFLWEQLGGPLVIIPDPTLDIVLFAAPNPEPGQTTVVPNLFLLFSCTVSDGEFQDSDDVLVTVVETTSSAGATRIPADEMTRMAR